MNIYKKFIYLIILSASLAGNSYAQKANNLNPYIVNKIFAFAQEENPFESRNETLKKANRTAFEALLGNLNIQNNISQEISDEEIAEAIYSRRITNERIAGNYYSANFNIKFIKNAINAILDDKKIQKLSKSQKNTFLLLPIEIINNKYILWESGNEWKKSLQKAIKFSNIRSIVIPEENYDNIKNIENLTSNNIDNDIFQIFGNSLTKYDANNIITAYLSIDKIENKANITLEISNKSESSRTKLSLVNSKNLNKENLLIEASYRTLNHILSKNQEKIMQLSKKAKNNISVKIPISNLESWLAIKEQISRMYFVKKLEIKSISKKFAKINIQYDKEYKNSEQLFLQYNFSLNKNKYGDLILSYQ